ncbi:diaminopropionate ammonia-lyase [Sulfidibacter corallicola]|uniref:Diaminopropionate ammonia-lyase n=1 Tax=Sulfidibacter corallicola TaxID=2818388 RepID=A0A8A4TIY9_SULCO|nr:diaminopropionate ammonia-lyase [Sulfidibacter corallicola]QTD49122.1 diaminopropionate ammonia-lyase [Sulfidibacter corallicola]
MRPSRFWMHSPDPILATNPGCRTDCAARPFHRHLPGYRATPLHRLRGLARRLGLGGLALKDESKRFGLNAFKSLGASYGIYRYVAARWRESTGTALSPSAFLEGKATEKLGRMTFCTATDGNHGRAVAWTARITGNDAVIFVPECMVEERRRHIEHENAEMVIVPGDYDAAVETAAVEAKRRNLHVISDTSWPGYEQIPAWIAEGYETMFVEIAEATEDERFPPDVVLLQCGVGAFPASAVTWFRRRYSIDSPKIVIVEPLGAACVLAAVMARAGETPIDVGDGRTIMAGLNCGTASRIALPALCQADAFLAIDDHYTRKAMRTLYHSLPGDPQVISGESGAAGLAGLMAILEEAALAPVRTALSIGTGARVLVVNTEGDTDPRHFREIVLD